MPRLIARFYLLAMLMVFLITIWAGARGASFAEIVSLALLAWPAAFFVMLARDRLHRILNRAHPRDRDRKDGRRYSVDHAAGPPSHRA